MLVKNVILKVCDLIENGELAQAIQNNSSLTDEQLAEQTKLVKCFNFIRNEIASEYIPIVKEEILVSKGEKISLDELSSRAVAVVSVKDKYDNNLSFKVFDEFIQIEGKDIEVKIKYHAYPEELEIDDEFSSILTERIFAYGVVKEYYFIQTLYEDAKIWDDRFKSAMQAVYRKKGNTQLPRRRWL